MKRWTETRAVLDQLAAWGGAGQRVALATVVDVRGSAYRRPGAKLLIAEDGRTAGNVSGGCLEHDVREVGLQVVQSGHAELRRYCSSSDQIAAWDLGVGCDGQVDVLVEPVSESRAEEQALLAARRAFAVCTVLPVKGRHHTGRLVVTADTISGSFGAGELERPTILRARELLRERDSGVHELAGRAVFIDILRPSPRLIVCGAGDDARPLARLATDVGFRVVVVDRRPALLTPERFPTAVVTLSTADQLALAVQVEPDDYAVVMTHHFADDQAYLQALLDLPPRYIGMLGPRQRTERMLSQLSGGQVTDDARIYGPIGLDLGAEGAEQVALAVLAEILAIRSGRYGRPLRERHGPVHDVAYGMAYDYPAVSP